MEENLQKLINDKDENVVQFNFTNSTSNPIYVDLFDSASLTPLPFNPAPTTASYPVVNTIPTIAFTTMSSAICSANNTIWYGSGGTDIYVYDINTYSLITTITIPAFVMIYNISYCSINNTMYVTDNSGVNGLAVIDCNTFAFILLPPLVVGDVLTGSSYNPNNNTLYVGVTRGGNSLLYFVDCTTNIITPSPLFAFSFFIYFSEPTSSNFIYFHNQVAMDKIDCSTNTISFISVPLILGSFNLIYNVNNDLIYITNQLIGGLNLFVFDTITDTILLNIPFSISPYCATLNPITNQLIVGLNTGGFTYQVGIVDCNTNTLSQTINYGASTGYLNVANYIPSNGYVWFGDSGIPTAFLIIDSNINALPPFYITGSANYNSFVNNLNNEPILIQMIRLFAQNQNQLTNQLQLTTIDSNGNQTFTPNFPINQVSAYQQQGNIGELLFKDIVFDGRTYINQYQLNPNETISFDIYYKQLNLSSASAGFPIFFKEKVQLKKYIKEDYSDYEIVL
jgi:hypothetical protein